MSVAGAEALLFGLDVSSGVPLGGFFRREKYPPIFDFPVGDLPSSSDDISSPGNSTTGLASISTGVDCSKDSGWSSMGLASSPSCPGSSCDGSLRLLRRLEMKIKAASAAIAMTATGTPIPIPILEPVDSPLVEVLEGVGLAPVEGVAAGMLVLVDPGVAAELEPLAVACSIRLMTPVLVDCHWIWMTSA